MPETTSDPTSAPSDFLRDQIRADIQAGVNGGAVLTRFPPEPNGYPHVGHAKSISLNFIVAQEFGGACNLRFDDTNPLTEDAHYVTAIREDIEWLGFEWNREVKFASDQFEKLYEWAQDLIRKGLAYVDDQTPEEISINRGAIGVPGTNSPWRDRAVEENLDLFARMRAGEFPDGAKVLRAKIDMAHTNGQMRDPIMYRIRHAHHHRTGDAWCIYPSYDWAHGQCDAIEGITHSICTLEFDSHRPLYDWFLDNLDLPSTRPRQYEFARLNLTHTITSKRNLLRLVNEGVVSGWDDPRMPTIRGMRRRGYPASAIRAFVMHTGVSKSNSVNEIGLLDWFIRTELNRVAQRRMAVLSPIKVIIENYPEGQVEWVDAVNNPEDPAAGSRKVPFSRELYIDADDFMEVPAPKYFRLSPGKEVRLRYGYFLTCTGVDKAADGSITAIRATYDPETAGGNAPDGRKVKATIHWVSASHAIEREIRLYDHLFTDPHPNSHDDVDPMTFLNPSALVTVRGFLEPELANAKPGEQFQFERVGYFCVDTVDALPSSQGGPNAAAVFHRTVGLKDEWARVQKRS